MCGGRWLTCGRGDADEASDHALDSADNRGFAEEGEVEEEPGEEAGGSADVGVQHGQGGVYARRVRIASVEPRPPHPQQPRPRQHQQNVVRREPLPVLVQPRPNLYSNFKQSSTNKHHHQKKKIKNKSANLKK